MYFSLSYSSGVCDHVKSFCCNIHLRSWSPEDIPIREHSRWSPNCDYVKERLMAENLRKQVKYLKLNNATLMTGILHLRLNSLFN